MDNQQVSADTPAVAVPSLAQLTGETPPDAVPPQSTEQAAPQIDWDAEKTRYEQMLADKEAALQQTQGQLSQIQTAAQQYVAQEAAKVRQQRAAERDAALEQGEITAAQYRAQVDAEVAQERAQMQEQVKQVLLPVWTQDYATSKGLTGDETAQLKGVPMEAVEWTVQSILANRNRDQKLREEIEQLKRSVGAQQVIGQGVTQTATGAAAGSVPGQYAPDDHLGRLRDALSGLGHAELIGNRAVQ